MYNITYDTITLIAITVGFVETIKIALKLNKRFLPIISVFSGIGIAFLAQNSLNVTISETILFGGMIGLTSCGLFSNLNSIVYVTKQTYQKVKARIKK